MLRNDEVIRRFFKNEECENRHLFARKGKLINYNTTLIQRDFITDIIYVNTTKYSVSTSKIQGYIERELHDLIHNQGIKTHIAYVDDVPISTHDLIRHFNKPFI